MKLPTFTNLQRDIFYHIQKKTQTKKNWIDELAGVLDKSKNSIYKKVSGEISLSLRELFILAEHYDLQLDPLIHPASAVTFSFPFFSPGENKLKWFFDSMQKQMSYYADAEGAKLWYAGLELPFMHDYNFPEITAFKFYIYQKTVWQSEKFQLKKFSFNDYLANAEFLDAVNALLKASYKIPSIEFWNSMILDITLSQIKYILESGLFKNPADASVLCEKLLAYVDHMQYLADMGRKIPFQGQKESGAEFTLYHNEVAHSNNLIYVDCPENDAVYLSFANPLYMITQVKSAVTYSRKFFNVVMQNSQKITKESRKSRLAFFNELRRKINSTHLEINTILKIQQI